MKKIIFTIAVICGFTIEALAAKDPCQGAEGQDRGESNSSTVQSCDPNEMAGPLGKGANRYVEQGEWMNYTIYFENKTNATAAAQEVFVDLPMDPNLDWSTLELGEVVFGEHIDTSLSGKSHGKSSYAMPGTNTFVKTTVTMKDGVLSWYLRDWDPTTVDNFPASATGGFLPPNNPDTHCGEGHLSYRVRVKADAPNGAVIRASAQIVFDSNPMIETDPSWWNTVGQDTVTVSFERSEISAGEGETLEVTVSGGAEEAATGVQLYATYNTAAAADLDLTKASVRRVGDNAPYQTKLKFPLTLTWEAGEIGEKVVSIPVKTDKKVDGDEFLTLQLANPVGMVLGETDVCTVTIEDKDTYATLQDGIMNPNIKVSTKGDGKWTVGEGSALNESGSLGLFHAESPALEEGEDSTLALGGIKGNGVMTFYVRFVGDPEEEIPSELDVYNGKKLLGTITHGDVTNAWERYTITTTGAMPSTTHDYHFVFTQGSDPETRVEMSDISWIGDGVTSVFNVLACNGTPEGGYTTGSGPYLAGKTAKLVAKPLPGWTFDGWYEVDVDADDDDFMLLASSATYSYKVTDHLYAAAFFSKIPYIRGLAGPADGGKVTGSGLCAEGKKVTLKASANKNFSFVGWYASLADNPNSIDSTNCVATTASLVIDRTSKPAASSKTSTTITGIDGDVTYYAVFKGDPRLTVAVEPGTEAGKITGSGRYAIGKKATVKATANKGYVFAGWYEGENLLTQNASYSFMMSSNDVELTAMYVTVDEDKAAIKFAINESSLSTNLVSWTNYCGVAVNWPVVSSGLSATTVKASGLPAGLKLVQNKTTKAYSISGAPTGASKIDRKTGLLTPSKAKFTVVTAGKSSQVFPIDMTILPLPAWAQGTFNGVIAENDVVLGYVQTLTVSAAGKLSAKLQDASGAVTLAANSYSGAVIENDEATSFLAQLVGKKGKFAVTNDVLISADESLRGVAESASGSWIAWQNLWKAEPWKTLAKPFAKAPVVTAGEISLKFAATGAVTASGKFVTGINEKTGKDIVYSASCSSALVPMGDDVYTVFLYFPPKAGKFNGYSTEIRLRWDGAAFALAD